MPTYLITGATRGIGRALVDRLSTADLILLARDAAALDELCATLPSARPLAVDLGRPEQLAAVVTGAGLPGRIDGVVHSAGISVRGTVAEMTVASWERQLTINVTAPAELTRLLLPALRATAGTVVFVNSGAGRAVKAPGGSAYAASKFALRALAEALHVEEPDLHVSTVYPGRVATDMQRELREWEGGEHREDDYLRPESVAGVIAAVLAAPADAALPEVVVSPRG